MSDKAKPSGALATLQPQSYADLEKWAERAARTDFVPREYRSKPDNIIVAVQLGAELGLHPMQSLQSIAVINGKPSIYGDALIAICKAHPVCEDIIETPEIDPEGNVTAYVCVARRRGARPVEQRFTVEDAKRANLWHKEGPWRQYPQRMLQMRARGFALRDAFPDLLKGLITREEAEDYPAGPTIEAAPPKPMVRNKPVVRDVPPVPLRDPDLPRAQVSNPDDLMPGPTPIKSPGAGPGLADGETRANRNDPVVYPSPPNQIQAFLDTINTADPASAVGGFLAALRARKSPLKAESLRRLAQSTQWREWREAQPEEQREALSAALDESIQLAEQREQGDAAAG